MKQQLDPKAVWYFFISTALSSLILLIIVFWWLSAEGGRNFSEFLNWLIIIFLVVVVISFVWAKLAYRYYRYELADEGFRKEYGVIWKKYTTIPYERIQNVDIRRGLVARFLGLSDLYVQTAGASASPPRYGLFGRLLSSGRTAGAEGHLPGVSKEVAEQLRDELIRRAQKT